MKRATIAALVGIVTFCGLWLLCTAFLPKAFLVPAGALSLIGAFIAANAVDNADP